MADNMNLESDFDLFKEEEVKGPVVEKKVKKTIARQKEVIDSVTVKQQPSDSHDKLDMILARLDNAEKMLSLILNNVSSSGGNEMLPNEYFGNYPEKQLKAKTKTVFVDKGAVDSEFRLPTIVID